MSTVLNLLLALFIIVQVIFFVYLLSPLLLLVFSTIYGKKDIKKHLNNRKVYNDDFDFAAIITVHQDARFIEPFIDSFLKQTYKKFKVYIVADDCDTTGIRISDDRIKIIRPSTPIHSKVKSIQYAVDCLEKQHDVMVIFDSDSLVHPSYFERLNTYFQAGYEAVQCITISKSLKTGMAKVETLGWVFTTFIERASRMMLGLSSTVSGNGIAIKLSLYKDINYVDSLGGFDKRLQTYLMIKLDEIAFAKDAIVFEEKTNDGKSFEKQRTRWIYSYFKYFNDNWLIFWEGLKKINFNKIFFGFSAMRPPLFLTMGISVLCMVINLLIDPFVSLIWLLAMMIFIFSFIGIATKKGYQRGLDDAILLLPMIVFLQFKAFFQMGKASKSFMKTEHDEVCYIDQINFNDLKIN
jgi:cellulose synthase/poly-beta-1,6-N-acetylglucosamine synthase-like glycosyltransferase